MVASIRNISARSVIIKQAPLPPVPGIVLRTTSGAMTYWSDYVADYPSVAEITGAYDPANLGDNGTLSDFDLNVSFSNTGSVIGTNSVPSSGQRAWEFLVETSVSTKLGYWFDYNCDGYNKNSSTGGSGGNYYQNTGTISGPIGSSSGAAYTAGDIIGVVVDSDANFGQGAMVFYKNGLPQGSAISIGYGFFGYAFTGCF